MAAQSLPCGLSFDRTLEIIKRNVLYGNYNGRGEVMQALLQDGFSYDEAKEVTDYYFKVYKQLSGDFKKKTPAPLLSAQQKQEKKVNNLAVAYLNGELGSFPMEDYDFAHLQTIYDKEAAADTPTLKAKYIDEANVFIQKFMPDYTDELFKSSVYARPLLSGVFFIKSLASNLFGQLERSINNSIWDGKKADFTFLNKFNDLANASFTNVLKGGVPATTLYQGEAGFDPTKGRVEEYSIEGTSADISKSKAAYYSVMKFMTKWSNRLNAAPDTRGIFHNAERHFYQLLKEKYRGEGMTNQEATDKALEDIELDDEHTAIKMAEDKFKDLGIEAYNANGRPTSEFNVAVAEYQRLKRDDVLWRKALTLSKNDFWKKNMMVPTELGFGDYGLFGVKAQIFTKLRDIIENRTKSKLASAFNLTAFGFINGAANFAEDALERVPPYAAVKLAFLQARKGKVTDEMLQNDIMRRQKDIIVKNITTASFFLMARMLENLICKGKSGKATSEQISSGRTQIGPCGIPVFVPPQMLATYKMYNIISEAVENDEEFFETAMNVMPVLVQSNQVGLGGAVDKIGQAGTNYGAALAQGNNVRAKEELDKGVKAVVRYGADVANTFLPLPSRLTSEAGTFTQRALGISQKQQELPFAIDEAGNKLGLFNTLGKVTVASLGNVTGISDIIIAANGANKNYAVDWQGRKVVQFRGSDITGSGVQYNAADDILATAGVKTPYLYRLQKIPVSKKQNTITGFLPKGVAVTQDKQRYMTDEEFFEASEALGKFNEEYFRVNNERIVNAVKKNKSVARNDIETVFKNTKEQAVEAIKRGMDTSGEILSFIKANWRPTRKRQLSTATVE